MRRGARLRPASVSVLLLCMLSAAASGERAAQEKAYAITLPPGRGENRFYVGNRPPLLPNPLIKLPPGNVRPKGWLLRQLVLMGTGMVGRLPEVSAFCRPENSAWMHPERRDLRGWEEVPYWLRGLVVLGYLLKAAEPEEAGELGEEIEEEARRWIKAALAGQEPDGYFGPRALKKKHGGRPDLWAHVLVLYVMRSFYEATGDGRVLPFMARFCLWLSSLPPGDLLAGYWPSVRGGDLLQSLHWLYNRTGEPWLLELGKTVHGRTAGWAQKIASHHGVNFAQGFREPAVFYLQSGDPKHLEAAKRNYRRFMETWGQVPGGMYCADEGARGGYTGPQQASETCAMAEFMASHEHLLSITGEAVWADRCEDVAFNSLPAAVAPDFKGLRYFTASNQVRSDRHAKWPAFQHYGTMHFSPWAHRCCQHNVSFGWPYYAEHLWMATRTNGLAAVMYAPCEVEARVGDQAPGRTVKIAPGRTVRIEEQTDYPFKGTVDFVIHAARPVRFPLLLRIPGWCRGAKAVVNGKAVHAKAGPETYLVIEREWKEGDRVRLDLPLEIRVRTWEKQRNAVSVDRGPLTYSLKIGERWERFGRQSKRWPEWEVFSTTPWNYGLVLDRKNLSSSFTVVEKEGALAEQPFDPENAPVELKAKGRRIPAWRMHAGLAGPLQESPVRTGEPVASAREAHDEEITLIPMGCARLRITVFPVVGEDPDAAEWAPPPTASHNQDQPGMAALDDGLFPRRRGDNPGHFTWWDHRGTTEWVAYPFPEPRRLSRSEVFWFDDTGRGKCRVPASWKLLWRDGEAWREVPNPSGYGLKRDKMNAVTFDPVVTREVRLEVKLREGFSGGVHEWRVE